ncbi:MAG: hypothetical protein HC844_09265 [Tabrizicola sp.]|nr:hypothetical protein [Tabrizicola sp.]
MARRKRPLFLDPRRYRRTRLRDAARLLPIFAAVMLILPLLWAAPGETSRRTSGDVIYFFVLWLLVIAIAAAFAPGLSEDEPAPKDKEEE